MNPRQKIKAVTYTQLHELVSNGFRVLIGDGHSHEFEVTVLSRASQAHGHYEGDRLSTAVEKAHRATLLPSKEGER